MGLAIVTGSSGLIGSETVKFLHTQGMDVIGIDNNMREYFFGADGSVDWNTKDLTSKLKNFSHESVDIRDEQGINRIFETKGKAIDLVVHTAAQPSHDWAAKEPLTDFTVNANGTLNLLEATRKYCPEAVFIFTSTNKVYGDLPNSLPLVETETRWELSHEHHWSKLGIDESMSIDRSKHSLFGASKVAADVLTQEYGRYFDMKTACFRGGCLTGPAHSGAELHGFLAYLVRCAITGKPYTIFGYKGKQVRDNIHSEDLVNAFWHFYQSPKSATVYNIGGSRHSNCSVLEAIEMIDELSGKRVNFTLSDKAREGDHMWWISDVSAFQKDFPDWQYKHGIKDIIKDIVDASVERYG